MEYLDEWGDTWIRISHTHVQRLKDGCFGAWWDGKGLVPKNSPKKGNSDV